MLPDHKGHAAFEPTSPRETVKTFLLENISEKGRLLASQSGFGLVQGRAGDMLRVIWSCGSHCSFTISLPPNTHTLTSLLSVLAWEFLRRNQQPREAGGRGPRPVSEHEAPAQNKGASNRPMAKPSTCRMEPRGLVSKHPQRFDGHHRWSESRRPHKYLRIRRAATPIIYQKGAEHVKTDEVNNGEVAPTRVLLPGVVIRLGVTQLPGEAGLPRCTPFQITKRKGVSGGRRESRL